MKPSNNFHTNIGDTTIYVCEKCGWQGGFRDGDVNLVMNGALLESSCPRCFSAIGTMLVPTVEEIQKHWDRLSDKEKRDWMPKIERAALLQIPKYAVKITEDTPFPDLTEERIVLECVLERDANDIPWMIFRHRNVELAREVTTYDGAPRFAEIVNILKTRYGHNLADVRPDHAVMMQLAGDESSNSEIISCARQRLSPVFGDR